MYLSITTPATADKLTTLIKFEFTIIGFLRSKITVKYHLFDHLGEVLIYYREYRIYKECK